jgi:hypothetical protein
VSRPKPSRRLTLTLGAGVLSWLLDRDDSKPEILRGQVAGLAVRLGESMRIVVGEVVPVGV